MKVLFYIFLKDKDKGKWIQAVKSMQCCVGSILLEVNVKDLMPILMPRSLQYKFMTNLYLLDSSALKIVFCDMTCTVY